MAQAQAARSIGVSIGDLPSLVAGALGGVKIELAPKYVRRKQGRGLAVIYEALQDGYPPRRVTAMLGDELRAHVFPSDSGLPALASACAPSRGGPVFDALEATARVQLGGNSWRVTSADAEAVRYKPGDRCVIRYRLAVETLGAKGGLTVFGKLYRDPEQAARVHAIACELYREQARAGDPIIPRPLAIVGEIGLTLTGAVEPAQAGLSAFQARRGCPGVPAGAPRLAGAALARLHRSAVRPAAAPRTGAKEAKRVLERACLIAAHCPERAQAAMELASDLASRLENLQPAAYVPAHGGFKPSQLLFREDRVFVVDLDGFCLADPALDAGYFLAYVRPPGLWRGRPGARCWFEDSAALFLDAYESAMGRTGNGIAARARLYAAAILFKIATRRSNRLNSPRPRELDAMLAEVAALLN